MSQPVDQGQAKRDSAKTALRNTKQHTRARLVRVLRSMFAFLARPDDAWARSLLSNAEWSVYTRMDPRDREHGIKVARALLDQHPKASKLAVRAALLHDCGKLVRRYNLLERILVGWRVRNPDRDTRLPSRELARAERLSAADVRRFHPQIGAWLIRAAGGNERVALMVEYHHHPGQDAEITWIHALDELE